MKKAFTIIELLICVAIIAILAATFIPSFQTAKRRAVQEQVKQANPQAIIKIGDIVYIKSMNIMGTVNNLTGYYLADGHDRDTADILVKRSDDMVYILEGINMKLLTKAPEPAESWR